MPRRHVRHALKPQPAHSVSPQRQEIVQFDRYAAAKWTAAEAQAADVTNAVSASHHLRNVGSGQLPDFCKRRSVIPHVRVVISNASAPDVFVES